MIYKSESYSKPYKYCTLVIKEVLNQHDGLKGTGALILLQNLPQENLRRPFRFKRVNSSCVISTLEIREERRVENQPPIR